VPNPCPADPSEPAPADAAPPPEAVDATQSRSSPSELRALAARLVDAREEERLRVARKLHDEIGQMLSVVRLDLLALAASADNPDTAKQISASATQVAASLRSLQQISEDLRPLTLDDLGLHAALEALSDQASRRMGIEVTLRRDRDEPAMDPRVSTALYRAAQEALDNVERHARATEVDVTLRARGDRLELTIEDNGLGLPADALDRASAWGLRMVDQGMRALGGSLTLQNVRGGGGRLRLLVPRHPVPDAADPPDSTARLQRTT